jgi:hypothetical protein
VFAPTSFNFFSFDFVEFFLFHKINPIAEACPSTRIIKQGGSSQESLPLIKIGKMFHGIHKI